MKRKFWSWPGNSSEQRCFIPAYTFLSTEIGDPWEYPITTFYFIQDGGADRSHSFYRNTSFINKEILSLWFFSNTHSPPCCQYVVYFGKELPDGPQLRTGINNYHCSALPARAGISQGIFKGNSPTLGWIVVYSITVSFPDILPFMLPTPTRTLIMEWFFILQNICFITETDTLKEKLLIVIQ